MYFRVGACILGEVYVFDGQYMRFRVSLCI